MNHGEIQPLRTTDTPLLQCFVVMPNGHIKRVLFERNLTSPILYVKWKIDPSTNRPIGLHMVDVDPAFKAEGYILLEEVYRAEDRLEDFQSYVEWSDHANTIPGADPLPEEYLPAEVLRRRRDFPIAAKRIKLRPPKGPKAEKPAKEGK